MVKRLGIERELSRIGEMAPQGYFLKLHVHHAIALYAATTYPPEWKAHYSTHAYQLHDPLFAWCYAQEGVIRWRDLPRATPDAARVLDDAAAHGLRFGLCCSVGPILSRSVIAAARGKSEFTDDEMTEFAFLCRRIHKVTEPPRSLTPAQVEALRRIEAGERHEAAAESLGISVSAFKARLSSARDKLMCGTTADTIEKAREYGLM